MHSSFLRTDHRPWALPKQKWAWRQVWCDLLFAHWPIAAKDLRPLVPPQLKIQEFDSTAWIGVVPFRMEGVMRRPLPDLPWVSAFPELNLRIYVEYEGKPGVWFLSLDATNSLAVWIAKRFFHLPYFYSYINLKYENNFIEYSSRRRNVDSEINLDARYRPVSEPYEAKRGSLEHWLTERYCLFAFSPRGQLYRTDIHHHPWPLQKAEAEFLRNDLLLPHGLSVQGVPVSLHFARRLEVVIWSPVLVSKS